MKTTPARPASIDEYIAAFPGDVQALLQKVRATIREEAPDAQEAISYQIPTFKQNGNLVHFAGFKNHIGLYPAPRGTEAFRKELEAYDGGKGTVKFPLDRPIPVDLIRRIVRFRVEENARLADGKAATKRASRSSTTAPRRRSPSGAARR